MKQIVILVIYSLISCLYLAAITYNTQDLLEKKYQEMGITYKRTYGGRFKFLTFLNLVKYFFELI